MPLYIPPKPAEFTRSHTLELHSSSNPRNSYYLEEQVKSATIDPRRSSFNQQELSYDRNEVKPLPLLISTTNNNVNIKSPISPEKTRAYQHLSPQTTQSIKSVNSSTSGGGFTQSQNNNNINGEDADFVSWIETSSLASKVRTGGTMGLGNGMSATSIDTDSIKSSELVSKN